MQPVVSAASRAVAALLAILALSVGSSAQELDPRDFVDRLVGNPPAGVQSLHFSDVAEVWSKARPSNAVISGLAVLPLMLAGGLDGGGHLKPENALLGLELSKSFGWPKKSLGRMAPFVGCQVVFWRENARESCVAWFAALDGDHSPSKSIPDRHILATSKHDTDLYCAFLEEPAATLCSTNRGLLEDVLARLRNPGSVEGPAAPSSLDWTLVDKSAPVWALRSYAGVTAETDPSCPIPVGSTQPMMVAMDEGALGLGLSAYADPTPRLRLNYATCGEIEASAVLEKLSLSEDDVSVVRQNQRMVITVQEFPEDVLLLLMGIYAYLGHGFFL